MIFIDVSAVRVIALGFSHETKAAGSHEGIRTKQAHYHVSFIAMCCTRCRGNLRFKLTFGHVIVPRWSICSEQTVVHLNVLMYMFVNPMARQAVVKSQISLL
eukprot:scaffold41920_cov23-Prasinocladus_malaysianus.AAC.1